MTYRRMTVADPSSVPPRSRRAFLTMRLSEGRQVLELSCETFYMRYQDACSAAAGRQVSNHDDFAIPNGRLGHATPTADALLAELERELETADELRLLEREWLEAGTFASALDARFDAFRARGGIVTFGRSAAHAGNCGAPES